VITNPEFENKKDQVEENNESILGLTSPKHKK
jgi:hypothetical protein